MAKIETLQTIAAGLAGNTTLNANMTKITTALNNTLSRDGSSPNSMSANIDMNSNKLINVADPTDNQDAATKAYIDALVLSGVPDGDKGDIVVSSNGTSWVFDSSVVTTFAKTLLDDANAAAMRTTLGLAIGTDVQGYDATLTALAAALTAANKIPYATATDTLGELDFKDEDNMASNSATALASQQSIKAYVDTLVASATLPDGDYGDITVSSSGTVLSIDADVIDSVHIAAGALDAEHMSNNSINGHTAGTVAAGDSFVFSDADDSGNLKTDTIQGILDLVPTGVASASSTGNTWAANGTITFAHGLGALPKGVLVTYKCTDAGGDGGFAQNDEILACTFIRQQGAGGGSYGMTVKISTTNCNIEFAGVAELQKNPSTEALVTLTLATKWEVNVYVWA